MSCCLEHVQFSTQIDQWCSYQIKSTYNLSVSNIENFTLDFLEITFYKLIELKTWTNLPSLTWNFNCLFKITLFVQEYTVFSLYCFRFFFFFLVFLNNLLAVVLRNFDIFQFKIFNLFIAIFAKINISEKFCVFL